MKSKNDSRIAVRRGILEHIINMNTYKYSVCLKDDSGEKTGKKEERTSQQPPCSFGLYHAVLEMADYKTGICSVTIEELAEKFRCSTASIHRAIKRLFEEKYLIRLCSNKPDFFIRGYERWNKKTKKWQRVKPPKNIDCSLSALSYMTPPPVTDDRANDSALSHTTGHSITGDRAKTVKIKKGIGLQSSNKLISKPNKKPTALYYSETEMRPIAPPPSTDDSTNPKAKLQNLKQGFKMLKEKMEINNPSLSGEEVEATDD